MANKIIAISVGVCLAATAAFGTVFTNLHSFSPDAFNSGSPVVATNADGLNPAGFVQAGQVLYGTTTGGGAYGGGTIFRVNTDGSGFTNLFSFNNGSYDPGTGTYPTSTGINPQAGLLLISNTLYGTTFNGGLHYAGTVFKIDTSGANYSVIVSFAYANGQGPSSGLTLYNNTLYGTTAGGGTNGYGTVFGINLTNLSFFSYYQFSAPTAPYGNVVAVSNNLYGFGWTGGAASDGYLFRVGPAGFADLFDFSGINGANPYSGPVASGNTLYGVTFQGGTNGSGTIFRVNIDGLGYTNLYSFSPTGAANTDGAQPRDLTGLTLAGSTLYGTTSAGGTGQQGTVFKINSDGSSYSVLYPFSYAIGAQPDALILSGNTLFGMTTYGIQGTYLGNGGIFALILQPTLTISRGASNVVLKWNDPAYSLYTASAPNGAYARITGAQSPYTNSTGAPQRFFKLE